MVPGPGLLILSRGVVECQKVRFRRKRSFAALAGNGSKVPFADVVRNLSEYRNRRNYDAVSNAIQTYDPSLPLDHLLFG